MCTNESPPTSKEALAVGLSISNSMSGFLPGLEHYRLQLYHYAMAERIRLAQQLHPQHALTQSSANSVGPSGAEHLTLGSSFPTPLSMYPPGAGYTRGLAFSMALLQPHQHSMPEEPKPQHSYIGLIAMAILSSPEKKLVLSDIYQHILEHYPYFRRRGPGWRNSIRHNLSLNDCFVKSGRSANGKGHYWAIHQANLEDFRRGDFRRRKAQRKVRRHMGLAVDEEPESPSPPPLPPSPSPVHSIRTPLVYHSGSEIWNQHLQNLQQYHQRSNTHHLHQGCSTQTIQHVSVQPTRKRQFDVASLLAPDDQYIRTELHPPKSCKFSCSEDEQEQEQNEEEVDVEIVVEAGSEAKSINEQCNWINPMFSNTLDQHSPSEQLQFRNLYVPTNMNTSSGT